MAEALVYQGTVEINATDVLYTGDTITLEDVRRLGHIPAEHKVYVEIPEPTDDPEFLPGQTIDVRHHRKFYSVSPSITGGAA
jgi:hypothetical protein